MAIIYKYQTGGPLYVKDKNDPKYISYQDSLAAYNFGKKMKGYLDSSNSKEEYENKLNSDPDYRRLKQALELNRTELDSRKTGYYKKFTPEFGPKIEIYERSWTAPIKKYDVKTEDKVTTREPARLIPIESKPKTEIKASDIIESLKAPAKKPIITDTVKFDMSIPIKQSAVNTIQKPETITEGMIYVGKRWDGQNYVNHYVPAPKK
jgi:hypothetical protein